MGKLEIPRDYRPRLKEVGTRHGFASGEAFAQHLIERGLARYQPPAAPLARQLEHVAEEQGYSSAAELTEHLLERGLRTYEEPAGDPAELKARLRGLGYID